MGAFASDDLFYYVFNSKLYSLTISSLTATELCSFIYRATSANEAVYTYDYTFLYLPGTPGRVMINNVEYDGTRQSVAMFIDIGTCHLSYKYYDVTEFYIRGEPRFFKEDLSASGIQKVYWLTYFFAKQHFGHFGFNNSFADFYVEKR